MPSRLTTALASWPPWASSILQSRVGTCVRAVVRCGVIGGRANARVPHAVGLAPLGFLGGPIVLRAAAYTGVCVCVCVCVCVYACAVCAACWFTHCARPAAVTVGSLAWVGANSPSEQFLWMGGTRAVWVTLAII